MARSETTPGPALNRSREPSRIPCRAAPAGGVTAETSDERELPENPLPPTVHPRDLSRRQAEHRDPADPLRRPGAGPDPHHGDGLRPARERGVAPERSCVENGDERLQVLPDDDVEGDGERRLVALGLDERGPVTLGKEREGEGEREERDGHRGSARASAERDGGETGPDAAVEQPAGEAHERPEEARGDDCGRERDQPRQEEQDQPRALAVGEPRLVGGAAEQRGDDEARAATSAAMSSAPKRLSSRAGIDVAIATTTVAATDDGEREREAGRSEHALAQARRRPARRPAGRRERADEEADEPAGDGADDGDHGALGHRQQPQVPAARPVPGEPAPRRLEIAPHARGRRAPRRRRAARPPRRRRAAVAARPPLPMRSVARSSSTGACTLYPFETAERAARARSLVPTRPSICHSRGCPAASGHTQA